MSTGTVSYMHRRGHNAFQTLFCYYMLYGDHFLINVLPVWEKFNLKRHTFACVLFSGIDFEKKYSEIAGENVVG